LVLSHSCAEKNINLFLRGGWNNRVGPYWIDIALIYKGHKIGIEVDGPGKVKNKARTKLLRKNGWKIIRVPVASIDKDPDKTARLILDYVKIVGLHC
jgi:very-short-patch-repair endonuclease